MSVENGLRENLAGALEISWDSRLVGRSNLSKSCDSRLLGNLSEYVDKVNQIMGYDTLVKGYADMMIVYRAKVNTPLHGGVENEGGMLSEIFRIHGQRIKERAVLDGDAQSFEFSLQLGCELMDPLGDLGNAFGSMVYCVHRCHIGKQRLTGTNIARGLFSTNVLLAS